MEDNLKFNIKNSTLLKSKKILVTGTAGFIGYHLALKLLQRGDTVIGLDYYDVNLKYARLNELGIDKDNLGSEVLTSPIINSTKYPKHKFVKMDTNSIYKLFESEKFDAAQAGVRYSIENPHAYIQSNVVGFMKLVDIIM